MVVENLGLGSFLLPATGRNHFIVYDYEEFYSWWNGYMSACNECVWIVPGTVKSE